MQEELRRSSTIGDSRGILYFAETVLKCNVILRESAQQLCSFVDGIRINFNCSVAFFEYLGFIRTSANSLYPTEEGKRLYSLLSGGFEEALCEVCLAKVATDELIDMSALRFDTIHGKYYFQKNCFPIAAAVFRNVLIQFNALTEPRDDSGYLELSERYEAIFTRVHKTVKRKISLDALKKQLEHQELQGEAAEEYVVGYEKARLSNTTLADKVKRISSIDVSAGYDLVSFECDTSVQYDRFIEVKSFGGMPHFYWSKNEIEVSKVYGDRYYLYLINTAKTSQPGYTPIIIRNPAKTVIESDGWLMQPTSYLVLPI